MIDFGPAPIEQVHDKGCIEFLENFGALWADKGREGEGFPFVWPGRDFRTDKCQTIQTESWVIIFSMPVRH